MSKKENLGFFLNIITPPRDKSGSARQLRFPKTTLQKLEFSETEIFSIWYLGQCLKYYACDSLMEAVFALTGIRIPSGHCDPVFWASLSCSTDQISDIVTASFQCISTCNDPLAYLSLFSETQLHHLIPRLQFLNKTDAYTLLSRIFSRDGRAKNEVHLREVAAAEKLEHKSVPFNMMCDHLKKILAPESFNSPSTSQDPSVKKKSEQQQDKSTTSPSVNLDLHQSPPVCTPSTPIPLPAPPHMSTLSAETQRLLTMTEEEAAELERTNTTSSGPPSILGNYLKNTTLTFLSEEGVIGLLNRYNLDWQNEVASMTDKERYGTMDYMCRTIILEQIQHESYDKERIQIIWPERRCAIQEIASGVSRKLCIDKPVISMITETYNMSKVLYNKLVSEGSVRSEQHGGPAVSMPPEQPADQPGPIQVTTHNTRPPYKAGHAIVKVGDSFMYVKI